MDKIIEEMDKLLKELDSMKSTFSALVEDLKKVGLINENETTNNKHQG